MHLLLEWLLDELSLRPQGLGQAPCFGCFAIQDCLRLEGPQTRGINMTSRVLRVVALAVLSTLCLFASASTPDQPAVSEAFGLDVSVERVRGSFSSCRAVVTDLRTGAVVFGPNVMARQAEQAKASSEAEIDGVIHTFELVFSADATTASYSMEVRRAGTLVFASKAKVTLAGESPKQT